MGSPSNPSGVERKRFCPYFGRPQPSNMRSYNEKPLCTACAERLTVVGPNYWRHASDPLVPEQRAKQSDEKGTTQ